MTRFLLCLLVLGLLCGVAQAAGVVKWELVPNTPGSTADGTAKFIIGNPNDDLCRLQLSVSGLAPNTEYKLVMRYELDGVTQERIVGYFTDGDGSMTYRSNYEAVIANCTDLSLMDADGNIVMNGLAR